LYTTLFLQYRDAIKVSVSEGLHVLAEESPQFEQTEWKKNNHTNMSWRQKR